MPFALQSLQTDLAYTAWANNLALSACSALTPEEIARDLGGSHHSLIETLHHSFDSERFWYECLAANALPPMDQIGDTCILPGSPTETLALLQREWPIVSRNALKWLTTQTAEDLHAPITSQLKSGEKSFNHWQILRHSINHSTLHRGQVVAMIRQLGHQPPQTDLMSFYFVKK